MVKITTATENQFIFNLTLKQVKVKGHGAWLGLHRKADTKFYWTVDTLLSGYSTWGIRQPDHLTEKCASIYPGGKGKWDDVLCKWDKSWITHAPVILCQRKSN